LSESPTADEIAVLYQAPANTNNGYWFTSDNRKERTSLWYSTIALAKAIGCFLL